MLKRRSQKREDILTVLKNNHTALSAAAVHEFLPSVDLTTIYRNLELFVAEGTVKKLHFGGNETVFEYQSHPHHHAVCIECDKVIHFVAPDEQIKKLLGLENFHIDELEVTVKGKCYQKK
jgi:Fe2+ or Zn2+ uptake regulation protein